jgi:hypothetical protein
MKTAKKEDTTTGRSKPSVLMSSSSYDCVARKQRVTAECLLPPLNPHSRIILPTRKGLDRQLSTFLKNKDQTN